VATPHATHYLVGKELLKVVSERKTSNGKPLHILMEKPMTTDIEDAINLYNLVISESEDGNSESQFWLNHSANYRVQTGMAREAISSGRLGNVRHVTASFASPLKWIFLDPENDGWNKPTGNMIGNGFGWGQSSHLLAFLFHLLPDLEPKNVFCRMTHSKNTGADIAHSATVECFDATTKKVVFINMSGTALLPGNQYSDPPIAKLVQIDVYGDDGSLHYSGNDLDPSSGSLDYRATNGSIEVLCDRFEFEAYDNEHYGPESIQNFVELCCGGYGSEIPTAGANVLDGLVSSIIVCAESLCYSSSMRTTHSTFDVLFSSAVRPSARRNVQKPRL
jgi:predicted dehydrogenase